MIFWGSRYHSTSSLMQLPLIDSILQDLNLQQANVMTRKMPALSSVLQHKDLEGSPMALTFITGQS